MPPKNKTGTKRKTKQLQPQPQQNPDEAPRSAASEAKQTQLAGEVVHRQTRVPVPTFAVPPRAAKKPRLEVAPLSADACSYCTKPRSAHTAFCCLETCRAIVCLGATACSVCSGYHCTDHLSLLCDYCLASACVTCVPRSKVVYRAPAATKEDGYGAAFAAARAANNLCVACSVRRQKEAAACALRLSQFVVAASSTSCPRVSVFTMGEKAVFEDPFATVSECRLRPRWKTRAFAGATPRDMCSVEYCLGSDTFALCTADAVLSRVTRSSFLRDLASQHLAWLLCHLRPSSRGWDKPASVISAYLAHGLGEQVAATWNARSPLEFTHTISPVQPNRRRTY